MNQEKLTYLQLAFQLKGSVIRSIFQRVIGTGIFGLFISLVYVLGLPVSQPIFGTVLPSIVLGLLLVFRTNTAYERFWEGRRWWGILVTTIRNLAWQIWVAVKEIEPEDRAKKIAVMRLLVAFAVSVKLYLRSEPANRELKLLMTSSQYFKLKTINNLPLEIARWLGDYLQQEYYRNCLNNYQLPAIQTLVNTLMETVGNCERILKTPIPLAYAIHLKQLLLIYCMLLPFQLVKDLGWWTGLVVSLISFTLFGIEEIGIEIENPFGYDANDLPLDAICATINRNIEDFISCSDSVQESDLDSSSTLQRMSNESGRG